MHKVEVGAPCVDGQVYVVAVGRYVSVDVGGGLGAVVCGGVDVYLLVLLVPVHAGVERAHASVLELEVVDLQVGKGVGAVIDVGEESLARCLAREGYGVEVDQVQYVGHLDALQVDGDGVCLVS